MGRTEGPDHGRGTEADPRQHVVERVRLGAAPTTSSRRPQWLPRADHFWLGQSLLGDNLTWFEHSTAGYAKFERLTPPSNPNDQPFSYLPWEASSRQGERLLSRQELDFPMQLGFVKVVPYALGELGYWGEDINGQA